MQGRIKGPETWGRLPLRPTAPGDLDAVLALERAPANAAFVSAWHRGRHQAAIDDPDADHLVLASGDSVSGYVILRGVAEGGVIELLRIVIHDKGRGQGAEAMTGLKHYAFERLGARRLWLDVFGSNARALHVYRKAGFQVEGTLREAIEHHGTIDDLIILAILRRDWHPDGPG